MSSCFFPILDEQVQESCVKLAQSGRTILPVATFHLATLATSSPMALHGGRRFGATAVVEHRVRIYRNTTAEGP